MEANPDYWGGRIEIDRWSMFGAMPETAPRIAGLLKGEVDIITQLPPDQGEQGQRQCLDPGAAARSMRGSTSSP